MKAHIKIEQLSVNFAFRDPDRNSIRGHLAKLIRSPHKTAPKTIKRVHALNNISLEIHEGERVGLLGTNGSGKTTLLKVLANVLHPTSGKITISGVVNSIFDPALGMDPEASGIENIRIRCMLMGVKSSEINKKIQEITIFSELGDAIRRPIKTYSAGMAMKLAFSIATSVEPEILLMDEWLSAGDARFVSKALVKMQQLIRASRILVLASHSEVVLTEWCSRLIWIQDGNIKEDGDPKTVLNNYRSYTSNEIQLELS